MQAGDSLATAFALFAEAENAGKSPRQASDANALTCHFFERLVAEVSRRLDSAAVTERVEQRLVLPAMELDAVDLELASSPARQAMHAAG